VALREPPDAEYDVPPDDAWEEGPTSTQAASKRRAAEAAVAAEQARKAAEAPPARVRPLTPEEEAQVVGEDDEVLEEDEAQSHTDLLRETLGAQLITEEAN
jgi:DNA polymerase-3 subunit gamma/tau